MSPRKGNNGWAVAVAVALALACATASAAAANIEPLENLSLEELSKLQVTSVSKAPEVLQSAPAAIFIITHDDIIRSGVTSVSEALRLAPNLQISQYSSSRYVAGARGFAGAEESQNFSNKLLILIDGRSVYSPLYSGVYLDVQDVLMDDIERIEVISGPGATLWGANAMNGVINIITRPAYITDSSLAKAGVGTDERGLGVRMGARMGDNLAYRIYAKVFTREDQELATGTSAQDDWHKEQAGFRTDWGRGADNVTVQGDYYNGREGQLGGPDQVVEGGNVLGRWQRRAGASEWQLQSYYDYTLRGQPDSGLALRLSTLDLELQQRWAAGAHRIVWGLGSRLHHYDISNLTALQFLPDKNNLWQGNAFVQDSIALMPGLELTLGLKAERATYSGWTPLPDLRIAWRLREAGLLWVAASRAIRAPTPFDHDVLETAPGIVLSGNPNFSTEKVDALEIGYRDQVLDSVSLSASVFLNFYDDLRTIELRPDPSLFVLQWDNLMKGKTWGLETWAKWQVTSWWRLSPGLRLLRKDLEYKPGATALLSLDQSGNDPSNQALLISSMDLPGGVSFDASLRHVGALPSPQLKSYRELNASFNLRLGSQWDVSLSGFNLLHAHHQEYPSPSGELISRSVLAQARWRF